MYFRNTLGRPLTKEEVDANFQEMEDLKTETTSRLAELADIDVDALEQLALDFNEVLGDFQEFDATVKTAELQAVYDDYLARTYTLEASLTALEERKDTLETEMTSIEATVSTLTTDAQASIQAYMDNAMAEATVAGNASLASALADVESAKSLALTDIETAKTQALADLQAFVDANTGV